MHFGLHADMFRRCKKAKRINHVACNVVQAYLLASLLHAKGWKHMCSASDDALSANNDELNSSNVVATEPDGYSPSILDGANSDDDMVQHQIHDHCIEDEHVQEPQEPSTFTRDNVKRNAVVELKGQPLKRMRGKTKPSGAWSNIAGNSLLKDDRISQSAIVSLTNQSREPCNAAVATEANSDGRKRKYVRQHPEEEGTGKRSMVSIWQKMKLFKDSGLPKLGFVGFFLPKLWICCQN